MDQSVIIAMAVFVYFGIIKDAMVGYLIGYCYGDKYYAGMNL